MGGSGKTALAKQLYDQLCGVEGFTMSDALWLDQCRSEGVKELQTSILEHFKGGKAHSQTHGEQQLA
jgi:hypothetical protein